MVTVFEPGVSCLSGKEPLVGNIYPAQNILHYLAVYLFVFWVFFGIVRQHVLLFVVGQSFAGFYTHVVALTMYDYRVSDRVLVYGTFFSVALWSVVPQTDRLSAIISPPFFAQF